MNALGYGIMMMIFCLVGYFFSWRKALRGNYKIAVFLLLICGLVLRIFVSCDLYLHVWDEQFHALVAKNLIQHPLIPTLYDNPILPYDFRNWAENHIWLHKQPLPLWSMAWSMSIFGINELALRLPSVLMSTLGIWLIFEIGSLCFNKRVAFISAFLYSINGLIIELTGGRIATDHIDIFFMVFIMAAILFSLKYLNSKKVLYNLLVGLSIGAAILCKWLPALIVLPIWLLFVLDSGNFKVRSILINSGIIIFTSILVFLPWQIYIHFNFPLESKWESNLNLRHFTEVLDSQTGSWLYYVDKIRINYGELIYIPLLWFIFRSSKKPYNLKWIAVLIWVLVPIGFFSLAQTKMQGYILFIAPALFLITASFWDMLYNFRQNHEYKWLFNIILIVMIALPARYAIERIKPFSMEEREPQWVKDLKILNNKKITNGILFNYDKPMAAMFYTNITAYEQLPTKRVITDLVEKGYTVLIKDSSKLTQELKDIKGVTIEE